MYVEDGTIYCSDEDGKTCLENNSLLLGNPTYTWVCFENALQKFNWVYTICEGESVSLVARRDRIEMPCICEECIPFPFGGPIAPPEVIWGGPSPLPGALPSIVTCNNAHCGSATVSPTVTTHYSAVTEADVYSRYASCGGGAPGPPVGFGSIPGAPGFPPGTILTYSDFLVIVEQCPLAKPTTNNQTQKTMNPSFNIYPNPASNQVFIDLPGDAVYQISLTDISGKVMKQINTTIDEATVQLKVNDLPKGMYLVALKNEQTQSIQKLIIE